MLRIAWSYQYGQCKRDYNKKPMIAIGYFSVFTSRLNQSP